MDSKYGPLDFPLFSGKISHGPCMCMSDHMALGRKSLTYPNAGLGRLVVNRFALLQFSEKPALGGAISLYYAAFWKPTVILETQQSCSEYMSHKFIPETAFLLGRTRWRCQWLWSSDCGVPSPSRPVRRTEYLFCGATVMCSLHFMWAACMLSPLHALSSS